MSFIRLIVLTSVLAFAGCSSKEAPTPSEGAAHSDEAAHEQHEEGEKAHGEEHGDEHGEEGHEEVEPDFARIDPKTAGEHGIEVAEAAAGPIAATLTLTGQLIIDPKRVALVRARFPGPIRSIGKEVGDAVAKGEALAQVESNESLTVYDVRSPIQGVVLERMTNVGDVASGEPLFRVGDLASLQAELKSFPKDQGRLRVGEKATVQFGDRLIPGEVSALVPELDARTQAMRVRVTLQVPKDLRVTPGQFVMGHIELSRSEAALIVPNDALQRLDNREVVFVEEAEGFRARAVTRGRSDPKQVEIVEGLKLGERYAAKGAFLLKAEIGKSQAEDHH